MEKKLPQRMCIACREKKDKKSLIRVVCNKEGEISLDFTGKKAGRGAYICNDINCINKLISNKLVIKSLNKKNPFVNLNTNKKL